MSVPNFKIKTPPAEVKIDKELVKNLLQNQHPDLADLPIQLLGSGWDNEMYRLGEEYLVRLPRRTIAVELIEKEQHWLPIFAKRLPKTIALPIPLRVGKPDINYPWGWSVLPWVDGKTANQDLPGKGQGKVLAKFLIALHQTASDNAPENDYRGVPLKEKQSIIDEKIDYLQQKTDIITPTILEIWQKALDAPLSNETRWIHGDLHARNVLVKNGVIKSIIDWGDMTSGDVATDLVATWTLFDDPDERKSFLQHYPTNPDLITRAKGWAVFFATVLLANGLADNPEHAKMGRAVFRRLEEDS